MTYRCLACGGLRRPYVVRGNVMVRVCCPACKGIGTVPAAQMAGQQPEGTVNEDMLDGDVGTVISRVERCMDPLVLDQARREELDGQSRANVVRALNFRMAELPDPGDAGPRDGHRVEPSPSGLQLAGMTAGLPLDEALEVADSLGGVTRPLVEEVQIRKFHPGGALDRLIQSCPDARQVQQAIQHEESRKRPRKPLLAALLARLAALLGGTVTEDARNMVEADGDGYREVQPGEMIDTTASMRFELDVSGEPWRVKRMRVKDAPTPDLLDEQDGEPTLRQKLADWLVEETAREAADEALLNEPLGEPQQVGYVSCPGTVDNSTLTISDRPISGGRAETITDASHHAGASPARPSPPGDTLKELLGERGISKLDCGRALGMGAIQTRDLLAGRIPVTESIAVALERLLGPSADFWLKRQENYDRANDTIRGSTTPPGSDATPTELGSPPRDNSIDVGDRLVAEHPDGSLTARYKDARGTLDGLRPGVPTDPPVKEPESVARLEHTRNRMPTEEEWTRLQSPADRWAQYSPAGDRVYSYSADRIENRQLMVARWEAGDLCRPESVPRPGVFVGHPWPLPDDIKPLSEFQPGDVGEAVTPLLAFSNNVVAQSGTRFVVVRRGNLVPAVELRALAGGAPLGFADDSQTARLISRAQPTTPNRPPGFRCPGPEVWAAVQDEVRREMKTVSSPSDKIASSPLVEHDGRWYVAGDGRPQPAEMPGLWENELGAVVKDAARWDSTNDPPRLTFAPDTMVRPLHPLPADPPSGYRWAGEWQTEKPIYPDQPHRLCMCVNGADTWSTFTAECEGNWRDGTVWRVIADCAPPRWQSFSSTPLDQCIRDLAGDHAVLLEVIAHRDGYEELVDALVLECRQDDREWLRRALAKRAGELQPSHVLRRRAHDVNEAEAVAERVAAVAARRDRDYLAKEIVRLEAKLNDVHTDRVALREQVRRLDREKEAIEQVNAVDMPPIPMRLPCPDCGTIHVDVGEFATRVHHTHACQSCGMVWRPAVVPTVGVRFLPGFKNEVSR